MYGSVKPLDGDVHFTLESCGQGRSVLLERPSDWFNQFKDWAENIILDRQVHQQSQWCMYFRLFHKKQSFLLRQSLQRTSREERLLRYERKFFQSCPKTRLLLVSNYQFRAQFDGEPVENLSKRHKANPKTKSTETAKAGDEVQPSHLWQPLEFCATHILLRWFQLFGLQLTIHCGLPKKDIHNCDVPFVGVVVHLVLIRVLVLEMGAWLNTLVSEDISSLSPMKFG